MESSRSTPTSADSRAGPAGPSGEGPRRLVVGLVTFALLSGLAGCGGDDGGSRPSPFINYTNAPDGEVVLDANGDVFRVTAREGCVWSDQYQVVTNWCLTASGARFDFGGNFVVLVSHPGNFGGCVTVLAEERSLQIIDIYVNGLGALDYAFSGLPAVRC